MQKEILREVLVQNMTTCSFAFEKITEENAMLRLNQQAASVGFIFRHIGETMNLFGQFFGVPTEVRNTTMGQTDSGETYDVATSRSLVDKGYAIFSKLVEEEPEQAWLEQIETPFFGSVSRVRLFSHVLFHNSHHAGQISMTLAKGH